MASSSHQSQYQSFLYRIVNQQPVWFDMAFPMIGPYSTKRVIAILIG